MNKELEKAKKLRNRALFVAIVGLLCSTYRDEVVNQVAVFILIATVLILYVSLCKLSDIIEKIEEHEEE